MVLGQYHVSITQKFRVAFPKKFREVLGEKLIITYGFEKSLIVTSDSSWKEIIKDVARESFLLPEVRDVQRFLLGGATELELDKQGRFVIPAHLREFAEVKEDVVFIGLGEHIEVWDAYLWKQYQDMVNIQIRETARKLAERIRPK